MVFIARTLVLVRVIFGSSQLFYKTNQKDSKPENAKQIKEHLSKNGPKKITEIQSDLNNTMD